jgi:gas vesicle protein
MSRGSAHLLFFTVGVTVGAAIGILYAPDEGKSTRDKLSFQLTKYRDKLKDILNKLNGAEVDNSPMSAAKSESQRIINDTRAEAEKLLSDVEALMGQITILKGKKDEE